MLDYMKQIAFLVTSIVSILYRDLDEFLPEKSKTACELHISQFSITLL